MRPVPEWIKTPFITIGKFRISAYFKRFIIKLLNLKTMKCNVGSTDRIIRIVIGLGIAIGGVIFESYWGLIGVVVLATAIFRFCPFYPLLGINTSDKES